MHDEIDHHYIRQAIGTTKFKHTRGEMQPRVWRPCQTRCRASEAHTILVHHSYAAKTWVEKKLAVCAACTIGPAMLIKLLTHHNEMRESYGTFFVISHGSKQLPDLIAAEYNERGVRIHIRYWLKLHIGNLQDRCKLLPARYFGAPFLNYDRSFNSFLACLKVR